MTDEIKIAAGRKPGGKAGRTVAASNGLDLPSKADRSLTGSLKKVASHKRKPPSTREGRKGILIYVKEDVSTAFKRLALQYDTTSQDLGELAFKCLFDKLGEPWPGD
ncbi:MAG: hypothetical protein R3D31_16365 [Hyphomicrobiaceae bacterium]